MEQILGVMADKLSGYDFIVIALIVAFTEVVVKWICTKCKVSDATWDKIMKYVPFGLGIVVYVVIAIIQKTNVVTAIGHGMIVGWACAGHYEQIWKAFKDWVKKVFGKGKEAVNELGEDVKKIVE